MVGDTSDAADGTQEVFLKAFRGIRQFRQGSSLKTWLYRIAIREALNQKRWFKRHLQKNVSIDAEPEEGQARFEIPDHGGTPFEQLASHEIQDAVQSALQQVPRSEEHTSELQSHVNLVCRLLLEKKKKEKNRIQ